VVIPVTFQKTVLDLQGMDRRAIIKLFLLCGVGQVDIQVNANVCYYQTYYFQDRDTSDGVKRVYDRALAILKGNYAGAIFQEEGQDEPVFAEIRTAQDFLYGGKLPFQTTRVLLTDYHLTHPSIPITNSVVMACVYPEIGIASVMISLTLKGASTDQMVFLRHMQGNGELLCQTDSNGNQTMMTITQVTNTVAEAFGVPLNKSRSAYVLEINGFDDYTDVTKLREEQAPCLYGMLTGDEGWEYVPPALAQKRLSENMWSSRKHVSVIAFASSFLMINLYNSPPALEYSEHQTRYFTDYYGEINPYFDLHSTFAGVNHGLLFAVEVGMIIHSFSQSILDRQGAYQFGVQKSFRKSIQEIKSFRRQVILTLNRVENIQISEMGELQVLVLESLKISPIIDRLKYLLELMESEMDLMYSTRTNTLVNLIAVIGLILSLLRVLGMLLKW
jgi:hypothetical protein